VKRPCVPDGDNCAINSLIADASDQSCRVRLRFPPPK
jgi:hypothetical protein